MGSNTKIRFKIVLYLLLVVFIVLVLRLYFLQVMSGELYAELASESIAREKTVSAPRGNIYDRNGKLLVKSVPVKAVVVEPYTVSKNEDVIKALSGCLDMSYEEIKEKVEKSNVSYMDRIILKQDIDTATMIYLKENSSKFPGVEVVDVYLREYNFGFLASHLLGYTGEIDEDRLKSEIYANDYEGGDQIGLTGLEETYESVMKGKKGKIIYEVDPLGKPVSILEETGPISGNDLYLTIDIDLQRVVEKILYESILEVRQKKIKDTDEYYKVPGGAVVVLSPKNGQILAMASYPTFNPELFVGGISLDNWDYLNDPENYYPLINRAVMSFPPGSSIKIVPAYAGLAEDIISERGRLNCAGVWLGLGKDFPKSCWSSHGSLDIRGAIKNSCDIYFYQVGYGLFTKNNNMEELLQKYLRIFGFGSLTGIDLPNEDEGLVPDKEWKKDYFKDQAGYSVWFPGDTVNMTIGQGDLLVTPLQMAQAFSILANRGIEYSPHLIKEIRDSEGNLFPDSSIQEYQDLKLNEYFIEIIEDGLVQVVSQGGTAASVFRDFPLDIIPVAGKTGTAEFYGRQDYAWFASYAPVGNPEYVIVAMLEEAGSGGSNVAPIIEEIYRYLFNID
ncbi:MAG: penicillin-binding protein 2 [Actinobacteria bacterium RBG_13_35_12]|nr:MAG: penicillin-binding protein 2 [Actinobacteria bacterium RBG_13_35_12]